MLISIDNEIEILSLRHISFKEYHNEELFYLFVVFCCIVYSCL